MDYCDSDSIDIAMLLLKEGAKYNPNHFKITWTSPAVTGDLPPAFRGGSLTEYQDKLILFGSGVVESLISDFYWIEPSPE